MSIQYFETKRKVTYLIICFRMKIFKYILILKRFLNRYNQMSYNRYKKSWIFWENKTYTTSIFILKLVKHKNYKIINIL